jgi:hypothetical protein
MANGKPFQDIIGGTMKMVPTTFVNSLDMSQAKSIQQATQDLPYSK